jgi:hypothetical protein
VKKHCVAATINVFDSQIYYYTPEKAKNNPELQFYMKIRQCSTNASLTVATPDGTVLGSCEVTPVAKMLEKWKALPAEKRRPGAIKVEDLPADGPRAQLPSPMPPGALVLKTFIRPIKRHSGNITPLRLDTLVCGWASHDVPREGTWVLEPEWQALVPAAPRKGDWVSVPRSLRDRIVRFHLADWYRYGKPWLPEEVRSATLTALVAAVSQDEVHLRLEGKALIANNPEVAKSTRGYEGNLHGRLSYHRTKKTFTRFDLIAVGDAWWTDAPGHGALKKNLGRHSIGMAFELAPPRSGFSRLAPRYLGDGGDRGYRGWLKEYLAYTK